MKQDGYFLIKIRKSINLYLFSHDKSDLEAVIEKGMRIVPCYKDQNYTYLEIDGKMIKIS